MYKIYLILILSLSFVVFSYAQPNKNMNTKFTLIKIQIFPKITGLTWNTFKTCKAYYLIDTIDAAKSTIYIVISNDEIPNAKLNHKNVISICKPHSQVFNIELKNKSGNGFKVGNYKYDGSDTKPLNGLPKIELIAKPSLSVLGIKQSKTYNFETSKEHTCQIISIDEKYIMGSFYFKDSEGVISGEFKAEIIKL